MRTITPGPWVYDIRTATMTAPETTMLGIKTGELIFECRCGPAPGDGILMSAAPDMLEALELLVGIIGSDGAGSGMKFSERIAKARAAIAKAKGVSDTMTCPLCNDTGEQRYWEGRWRDTNIEMVGLRWAIYQAGSMHAGGKPIDEIMIYLRNALDDPAALLTRTKKASFYE